MALPETLAALTLTGRITTVSRVRAAPGLPLTGRTRATSRGGLSAFPVILRGHISASSEGRGQSRATTFLTGRITAEARARGAARIPLPLTGRIVTEASGWVQPRIPVPIVGRISAKSQAGLASILPQFITGRTRATSGAFGILSPVPTPQMPPLPAEIQPVPRQLVEYLDLVTGFHNQRPNFMSTVALSVQPEVDAQALALSLVGLFDLDSANGQALDFVGQWIGVSRVVNFPIDPWFSFDTQGLGFDQGKWMVPYEDFTGLTVLDDLNYRILLYARVAANYWDGTLPGAYAAWNIMFQLTDYEVLIQDNMQRIDGDCHGDMSNIWMILGPPLNQITRQLFTGGYLGLKSAGVRINYGTQDQINGIGKPLFAFDCGPTLPPAYFPPTTLAGFDMGGWVQIIGPTSDPFPPGLSAPMPDAPSDGSLYGRQSQAWLPALPISGGAMNGTLRLAQSPADANEAATKQYADNRDGGTF